MNDWPKKEEEEKTPGAEGGEAADSAGTPPTGEGEATKEEEKEEGAVGGEAPAGGGTPAWGAPEEPKKADEPADKPAE